MTPDDIVEARPASLLSARVNSRNTRMIALILVALPIIVNAIALFPEALNRAPSDNDQIFHYLFIERANQALMAGDNPVDHWLPELELGFPQFRYYQNLPHLTVVALYHLLFERVSLVGILNVVRYLLMVLFPLTVYWSMRRMEFSLIAAAVGAAFSSTLSSAHLYGFDYRSYISGGLGMFPQLCSMHLMFIGIAYLHGVLQRGKGFVAASITAAAVVLSDLLYGYIYALAVAILLVASIVKEAAASRALADAAVRISRPIVRVAIVALAAGALAAYQILPFLTQFQYVNQRLPDLPPRMFSLFRVGHAVAATLLGGAGYDDKRWPVTSLLVLLGIAYAAITRSRAGKLALLFFGAFIFLILAPIFLGPLVALIPLWRLLPLARLISGRDFAAIMLAGLGGELIWMWWPAHGTPLRAGAAAALLVTLCVITLVDRWTLYQSSARGMELTTQALVDDTDAAQIIDALKKAPPGRVYAGTRGNWGTWMSIGVINFFDLLPIQLFDTVMPWQTLSLNSLYLWNLNIPDLKFARLFNIRYVIAPPRLRVPQWYHLMTSTYGYNLYELDSGGYLQLGQVAKDSPMKDLIDANRQWLASDAPAQGRFIEYQTRASTSASQITAAGDPGPQQDSAQLGSIEHEVITPDSMSAEVTANASTLLVFKVTYHPNWHVIVDGQQQPAFMVSPSFIGTMIPPGRHQVTAEYRSGRLKKLLMLLSCVTLAGLIGIRFFGLEQRVFGSILFPGLVDS
jgi:hypothetical protein